MGTVASKNIFNAGIDVLHTQLLSVGIVTCVGGVGEDNDCRREWCTIFVFIKLETTFDEADLCSFHTVIMPPPRIGAGRDKEYHRLAFLRLGVRFFDPFRQFSSVRRIDEVAPPPFTRKSVYFRLSRARIMVEAKLSI